MRSIVAWICVAAAAGVACALQAPSCPVGTNGHICSGPLQGTCQNATGTCACQPGWVGSSCSFLCGEVTVESPSATIPSSGETRPVDWCEGNDASDCGDAAAAAYCQYEFGKNATCNPSKCFDENGLTSVKTVHLPSFSTCDPVWIFHECHPFAAVYCVVPCPN